MPKILALGDRTTGSGGDTALDPVGLTTSSGNKTGAVLPESPLPGATSTDESSSGGSSPGASENGLTGGPEASPSGPRHLPILRQAQV